MVPDNREVAANARPSVRHAGLCTLAEHEPCTGVPPRMDPLLVMEEDPLLHSLVDLREPTCRRCIQLRQDQLDQLVGQSGEHCVAPQSGAEAL